MTPKYELVGPAEIAKELGVTQQAVSAWIARKWPIGTPGKPPADLKRPKAPKLVARVSGVPIYKWRDVERWAQETGRSQ